MKNKIFSNKNFIIGISLILVGILVYNMRPQCAWYQIFCNAGSLVSSPIYFIISAISVVVGIILIIKSRDD